MQVLTIFFLKFACQISEECGQSTFLSCSECTKQCKTKQGLERHMRANHKLQEHNTSLETSVFVRLINDSASKLSKDDCFPDSVKKNFKKFILCIDPLMPLVKEYQRLVNNFQGNAETLYSKAYGINNNSKVIGDLDLISTRLMLGELANNILSYIQMLSGTDTQKCEIDVIRDKKARFTVCSWSHFS